MNIQANGIEKDWDEKEISEAVASKFDQRDENAVEGPARLGSFRAWRVWTFGNGKYHAHYALAKDDEPLLIFRNFQPFADWLRVAFDDEKRVRELALTDERRRAWARLAVAAIIVLVMLGLVVFMVVGRNDSNFSVTYVVTALLGGGVAYLLGDWVRKRP